MEVDLVVADVGHTLQFSTQQFHSYMYYRYRIVVYGKVYYVISSELDCGFLFVLFSFFFTDHSYSDGKRGKVLWL